ncbi:hypothetical protein F443_09441 [Phytophthora nicotianae P1569]|uniref:PiggyBac transposable element-derived protein domain-containing protein n=1 Tax=Phytophthora nicotianae P1569 TaxID=1317065 RepID=V9F712_PHYNI|nr:hypothetical protein F443_09441 [Phytophthora nicotianae P1569]
MSRARYMAILNIFSKSKSTNDDTEQHWKAPLSHARNIAHIEELVRCLCAEIGFVQHETIASHDDDMIRLRSAPVGEIGPTHVRNAKRDLILCNTEKFSLTTGMFLGVHVATRGE